VCGFKPTRDCPRKRFQNPPGPNAVPGYRLLQKRGQRTVGSIYFTEKLCFMPSLTCGLPVLGSGRKQRSV
jgi:hypothetical protein